MKKKLRAQLIGGACVMAMASTASAEQARSYNIPQRDLGAALQAYTRQSNQQIIYRLEDVSGIRGKPVRGTLTSLQALQQMLDGTPLEVQRDATGAFAVRRVAQARSFIPASTVSLKPQSVTPPIQETYSTPSPELDEGPSSVDEVIVTGSRIARNDLTATSPLIVVGQEDIRATGSVSLENVMNQFPQLAGGRTSTVNSNGGSGVLTANLRSLGASRTLVLVNGRRFVPADADGTVDLASIPDALIQKVDIVTGGASAIYGSDAVAGAVNFILKRNFEGLEMAYTRAETSRGDGISDKLDVTMGANLADGRGNVVLSVSHAKRESVLQSNRAFSSIPLDTVDGKLTPGGSGAVPGTRIGLSAAQRASLVGVDMTPRGDCSAITGIVFRENGVPGAYCNPEDAYNYSPYGILQRPLTRTQATSLARYNISDNTEAYAEAFYALTNNNQRLAPDSQTLSTPGAAPSTLLVANYATNPALSQNVCDFFINNAHIFDRDGDGVAEVVGSQRRSEEVGIRQSVYDRASLALTGGLRGEVALMNSPWKWDVFYQYQRNRGDISQSGYISQTRLGQSLNAIQGPNGAACVDPTRGCVPVGIFGYNSISPDAAAFLTPYRTSWERFEREVFGGSIAGQPFSLPAGDVDVALGFEYRTDHFVSMPSAMDLAGEYGIASQSPVDGTYDLREIFGEFHAPILRNLPFAHSLSLDGAIRYGDYSTVGGVMTWKLGSEYAPISWVRFRTAYNEAIRAPNISELFAPLKTTPQSVEDPCIVSRKPTAAQKQFCVLHGVSASEIDTFQQSSPQLSALGGGNANLAEERSKTFTIGAVIQPVWVPRLNLAIDYFKIDVDNAITSVNANQTLNECYRVLDMSSPACRSIDRLANGQIDMIRVNLQNIGAMSVSGVDIQSDYKFDLPDILAFGDNSATLGLQLTASWLFERAIKVIADQPAIDCAGYFGGGCTGTAVPGTPDFKLRFGAVYNSGPLNLRLQTRMIGQMELYPGVSAAVNKVSAQWYADLTGRYSLSEKVEIFGGVENLLDRAPPIQGVALVGDANTDVALYDVLGRRYHAGIRLRF